MEICARSLFVLVLIFSIPASSSAGGDGTDCGFVVELPAGLSIKKDPDVRAPLCSYLDAGLQATPFVNSVTIVPWTALDELQVNGRPLRDIGFFRLLTSRSVRYLGRPSYSDPRNGYEQRVVKKPVRRSVASAKTRTLVVRSELKVKWLKPIEPTVQEEVIDTFVCTDAAVSDHESIAIMNWCLSNSDPNVRSIQKAAHSLRLIKR